MIKPATQLFLCTLLISGISGYAQNEATLEFLKAEIQRTAQERDETQKRLLETESLSADKVKILSEEQSGLQKTLNQTAKSLLELEAAAQISELAIQRSQQEISVKEKELQTLKQQQIASKSEFEKVTQALNAKLAEAQSLSLENTDEGVAKLAAQRDSLREELQTREQQLADLEAARQQDLVNLNVLQEMNQQLNEDLTSSQRNESLANAKLAALEYRLGNLQQELANQYEQRSELEQEKIQLESEIAELQKDFENVRKQRDLSQAKEKTLISKLDKLESLLDASAGKNRALSKENEFLQQQLREERQVRNRMGKNIDDLRETMQKAKDAGIEDSDLENVALIIAEMEREKEAYKAESLEYRKSVDLLSEELDNQNSTQQVQIRELQTMLVRQLDEITAYQKQIQHLEARASTLDDVRAQKNRLVTLQQKSRGDLRKLAGHIYELRDELIKNKEMQRKAVLAIQKNQELASEIDAVRAEMNKMQRLNSALQNVDDAKEDRIFELRKELEIKKAQSDALEREKRALIIQLRRAQTQPTQNQ